MSKIVAENVVKRFSKELKPAIDGVSFAVEAGELVVLLGPSGCGKTTLMKMVNRLYEPTSGRILIDDKDIKDLPTTQLRRSIGYVIQQTGLFPHMRIEQNIAVVPNLLGWEKQRTSERTDMLLELVGLPTSYRSRYPRQLSGGEQQRVGIARAMAADPAVMLMDEPFGAIDAITRTRLQDEFLDIQQKVRKTILFVTHDVEEALRLADKIIVMRKGEVVQYDTPLNIVMNPADSFVQELVGTEDMLRRLSMVNVGDFLEAHNGNSANHTATIAGPTQVSTKEDLRSALSQMLRNNTDTVEVVNDDGQQIGQFDFDDMRAVAVE